MNRMIILSLLAGCAGGTPAPADQVKLGAYEAALQACIVQAKASDGGFSSYEACAKGVDQSWYVDGGAK